MMKVRELRAWFAQNQSEENFMRIHSLRRLFTPILFAGLLFLSFSASFHATARSTPAKTADTPFATIPVSSTVYVPMVSNYVRPVIKFGADFGYMTAYTDVSNSHSKIADEN
jgi:hypothetical protein